MLAKMSFNKRGVTPWVFLGVLCAGILGLPTFKLSETQAQKKPPAETKQPTIRKVDAATTNPGSTRSTKSKSKSVESRLNRLESQIAEIRDLIIRSRSTQRRTVRSTTAAKPEPRRLPNVTRPKSPARNPFSSTQRRSYYSTRKTTRTNPNVVRSIRTYSLSAEEAKLISSLVRVRYKVTQCDVAVKGKLVVVHTTAAGHQHFARLASALLNRRTSSLMPAKSPWQPNRFTKDTRVTAAAKPSKPVRVALPWGRTVSTSGHQLIVTQEKNGKIVWQLKLSGLSAPQVNSTKSRLTIRDPASRNEFEIDGKTGGILRHIKRGKVDTKAPSFNENPAQESKQPPEPSPLTESKAAN